MAKGKYHDWLTPDGLLLIKGWARDGLTDKEISDNIGVSQQTFCEWRKRFPEFSESIKKGRRPVLVEVEDTFFEKKLKGHYVDEEITEKTVQRDSSGAVIGSTEHKRISKRYIAPDTTAMIFFMKCRMSEKYNDKINLTVDDKRSGQLADLIEGLKENDIYSETAAFDESMADEPTETN